MKIIIEQEIIEKIIFHWYLIEKGPLHFKILFHDSNRQVGRYTYVQTYGKMCNIK